jgi:hypothetical protein
MPNFTPPIRLAFFRARQQPLSPAGKGEITARTPEFTGAREYGGSRHPQASNPKRQVLVPASIAWRPKIPRAITCCIEKIDQGKIIRRAKKRRRLVTGLRPLCLSSTPSSRAHERHLTLLTKLRVPQQPAPRLIIIIDYHTR